MAGPGGGPPRKSHTKSRTGCQTCKRRHIRCDETFPQCQNCTKHTCRCDYMDAPTAPKNRGRLSGEIDLLWTPEVEREIQEWRQTGLLPCSNNILISDTTISKLAPVDLRLIHHVASTTAHLDSLGASQNTIWTQKIPTFLALSDHYDYVMHSILAFSAANLAWMTNCPATENLAFHHRGIALRGLQQAIPTFSKETSDAVLGASLLLSWQSNTFECWHSLEKGTIKVVHAMQPWRHESHFYDYCKFLSPPNYASGLQGGLEFTQEDLSNLQYLNDGLANIESSVAVTQVDSESLRELRAFLDSLLVRLSSVEIEDQFRFLQRFRSWMLWLPSTLLQSSRDPGTLTVLAYFYATALTLEALFPEIGSSGCGKLVLEPLRHIAQSISALETHPILCGEAMVAMNLLNLPLRIAKRSHRRLFGSFEKISPYMDPHNFSPPFESNFPYEMSPVIMDDQQEPNDFDSYDFRLL